MKAIMKTWYMEHQAVFLSPLHGGRPHGRNIGIRPYSTVNYSRRPCTSQSVLNIAVGYLGADVAGRSRKADVSLGRQQNQLFYHQAPAVAEHADLVRDRCPAHENTDLLEAKPPSLAQAVET